MKIEEKMKALKILYVEDEQEAREELVDVLKRRAGKVYVADNGEKGVALAEDHDPDLIITDLYMPEMNGLDMIRKIRESGKNPAVIVVTASDDVNMLMGAIDVGVYKYILKPVNMRELLQVLEEQAEEIFSKRKFAAAAQPENRKQLEDEVKREFAAFLKSATGKGPKDVSVFIGDGRVEMVASGSLTPLEKSLMENGKNIGVVKYIREVFFSSKEEELCRMLTGITGMSVSMREVIINVEKDKNKLIFIDNNIA